MNTSPPILSVLLARIATAVLCLLLLVGCTTPAGRLKAQALDLGFTRDAVQAGGFTHLVFRNAVAAGDTLNVYLEGDGSPWRYRRVIMADPTPRNPLMLKLMSQDASAALYLGRPCYNGSAGDAGCRSDLWTYDRYSETVVASMVGALRRLLRREGVSRLNLFGHSGGGALAMLIAARMSNVSQVVTLAGNLDTDAWTSHHRYSPLYGSLNPATQPPLRASIVQWHLLGGKDRVIPVTTVRSALARQLPGVVVRVFPDYSHGCCWAEVWPRVLEAVLDSAQEKLPGTPLELPGARLADESVRRSGLKNRALRLERP